MIALVEEPDLVRSLVGLSVETNLAMAREVARCGADFVFTGDDYASADRPFMSPEVFREFFYPGLRQVVAGFHEAGLPVIKHTDGNIRPLLDMILDSGIDCLDPIDPIAGMDIGEMKTAVRRPDRPEGKRGLCPNADLRQRAGSGRPRRSSVIAKAATAGG